jgi:hypothetical protein
MTLNKTRIPELQKEIIKEALRYYLDQYNHFNCDPTDREDDKIFDLGTLLALMNYDVSIELTREETDNFAYTQGIDLPNYIN